MPLFSQPLLLQGPLTSRHRPSRNGPTSPAGLSTTRSSSPHQAEVKRPTSRMAISMATQGSHQQRIKFQQEGKQDQGEVDQQALRQGRCRGMEAHSINFHAHLPLSILL